VVGSGGASAQGGIPGSEVSGAGGRAAGAGAMAGFQPTETDWDGAPTYSRMVRLTNSQWQHAVTDILRLSAPPNLAEEFEPAPPYISNFTNNEHVLIVGERQFKDYEAAAEAAAALATGSASALEALSDETTAEGFVRVFGKRAFRRPLTQNEEVKYQQVFTQGEALYGAGFANGASLVIRAMLQSPQFLYRSELGPAGEPLSSYELASKLSFWLLDTTPSDALLDAAAAGTLDSVDALEATAREMLEDPRARDVMLTFHAELYALDRPYPYSWSGVPEFTDALHAEFVEASHRFFVDVFTSNGGLRELLTSDRAYVGPNLAPFYGITPQPSALEARVLAPSRIGYFMQVPFLLLTRARNGRTDIARVPDPIGRGGALERRLLCGMQFFNESVPLPQAAPNETNRQRISKFTNVEVCNKCHQDRIDSLGFAFENFDGFGQERQTDNGFPIDTSARYPFTEGVKEFADGKELMTILASSEQAHLCYAKMLTSYGLQRDIIQADSAFIETLAKVSRSGSTKELVISLIKAPAFRMREAGNP
jgi:hypothetical protein